MLTKSVLLVLLLVAVSAVLCGREISYQQAVNGDGGAAVLSRSANSEEEEEVQTLAATIDQQLNGMEEQTIATATPPRASIIASIIAMTGSAQLPYGKCITSCDWFDLKTTEEDDDNDNNRERVCDKCESGYIMYNGPCFIFPAAFHGQITGAQLESVKKGCVSKGKCKCSTVDLTTESKKLKLAKKLIDSESVRKVARYVKKGYKKVISSIKRLGRKVGLGYNSAVEMFKGFVSKKKEIHGEIRAMTKKFGSWVGNSAQAAKISLLRMKDKALRKLKGVGKKIKGAAKKLKDKLGNAGRKLKGKLENVSGKIKEKYRKLTTKIGNAGRKFEAKLGDIGKKFKTGFKNTGTKLKTKISNTGKKLNSGAKKIGKEVKNVFKKFKRRF